MKQITLTIAENQFCRVTDPNTIEGASDKRIILMPMNRGSFWGVENLLDRVIEKGTEVGLFFSHAERERKFLILPLPQDMPGHHLAIRFALITIQCLLECNLVHITRRISKKAVWEEITACRVTALETLFPPVLPHMRVEERPRGDILEYANWRLRSLDSVEHDKVHICDVVYWAFRKTVFGEKDGGSGG